MSQKDGERTPAEELTVDQVSAIGMNALVGMGVKAAAGLHNGMLRYEIGADGEEAGLDLLDLAAVTANAAAQAYARARKTVAQFSSSFFDAAFGRKPVAALT